MITEDEREDDEASALAEAGSGHHRRSLLRAAAGGLVLAASGLSLPDQLAETEAREGALDGAKGGRRGKNRRGRHRKRTNGDKRDKNRSQDTPRGTILDVIKFSVEFAGPRPVKIDRYDRRPSDSGDRWVLKESKTVAPGTSATFSSFASRSALWIDSRYWVEGESLFGRLHPAKLKLGYDGAITANPVDWQGGTIAFDEQMWVGRKAPAMVIDGFSTQVTRLADEAYTSKVNWNVFKVVLAAPA